MTLTPFLLRTFRTAIVFPVIVGLIAGASGAALIALINVRLGRGETFGTTLVLAYAGLAFVVLVTNYLTQMLLNRLAQGSALNLSMRLSEQILASPLRHQEQLGAHRIMTALTDDIPSIIGGLLSIPTLCINVATLVIFLLYLGWLSKTLLVGMFVFMALGIGMRQILVRRGLRWLTLARQQSNVLMSHYRALTEGAKELKLHNRRRQVFFNDVMKSTAATYHRHVLSGLSIYTAADSWSKFLYYVFLGLLLFALPLLQPISLHTLTGYALVVLYIIGPLTGILNSVPAMSRAGVALRQIEELKLTLASAGTDSGDAQEPSKVNANWKRLELVGVTHSYRTDGEDHNFMLGPVDADFQPGEVVFLVGGNGSGKTTFAKLLTGLYSPEAGEIRLDGAPVTDANREWYRQHFSVVFADFYLFEKLLGIVADDLDAQVGEYLVKLQLAHKVKVKDGMLSTTELSYGQRKRLALLTAYLEDRPFYVFDEWAAGQDPVFKELFYTLLVPELKRNGKTVLIISHDEKYFHLADRLLKLDYGRLVSFTDAPAPEDVLCETS